MRLTPKSTVHVTGVGQGGEMYTLVEIHFHWSSRSYSGSEHAINGVKFPLEVMMMMTMMMMTMVVQS